MEITINDTQKEFNFFLDGYKPAITFNEDKKFEKKLKKLDYPHCKGTWIGNTLFFQNEKNLNIYQKKMEHCKHKTIESQIIIGQALGYPTLSVTEFVFNMNEGYQNRAYISYYGMFFASFKHIVIPSLRELILKIPVPDDYNGKILVQTIEKIEIYTKNSIFE
jgi:hypothetical protein